MVLRHKWLKVKENKDESFTDFMAREKASRSAADVSRINTDQLVAHVILAVRKDKEEKGGRAQQVKGKKGHTCFKCQTVGHFFKECKMPKSQLKCSHCDTEGRHAMNDFCKRYIERKKTEENKAGENAKANKVEGRDDSPAGGVAMLLLLL